MQNRKAAGFARYLAGTCVLAVALFQWAVSERKLGRRIISESVGGERNVLVFPRLERVAPDASLPRVQIQWTERELQSLAKLTSAGEANRPTEALIRTIWDSMAIVIGRPPAYPN